MQSEEENCKCNNGKESLVPAIKHECQYCPDVLGSQLEKQKNGAQDFGRSMF